MGTTANLIRGFLAVAVSVLLLAWAVGVGNGLGHGITEWNLP